MNFYRQMLHVRLTPIFPSIFNILKSITASHYVELFGFLSIRDADRGSPFATTPCYFIILEYRMSDRLCGHEA